MGGYPGLWGGPKRNALCPRIEGGVTQEEAWSHSDRGNVMLPQAKIAGSPQSWERQAWILLRASRSAAPWFWPWSHISVREYMSAVSNGHSKPSKLMWSPQAEGGSCSRFTSLSNSWSQPPPWGTVPRPGAGVTLARKVWAHLWVTHCSSEWSLGDLSPVTWNYLGWCAFKHITSWDSWCYV